MKLVRYHRIAALATTRLGGLAEALFNAINIKPQAEGQTERPVRSHTRTREVARTLKLMTMKRAPVGNSGRTKRGHARRRELIAIIK